MRTVVVDANVLVSFFVDRNPKQRAKPLPGLADASIVALATTHRYDAIATFDQKLAKRAKDLGVASYW